MDMQTYATSSLVLGHRARAEGFFVSRSCEGVPLNSQAIEATPMRINISPEKLIDGWKMKLPSKHGPFSGDMLIFAREVTLRMLKGTAYYHY